MKNHRHKHLKIKDPTDPNSDPRYRTVSTLVRSAIATLALSGAASFLATVHANSHKEDNEPGVELGFQNLTDGISLPGLQLGVGIVGGLSESNSGHDDGVGFLDPASSTSQIVTTENKDETPPLSDFGSTIVGDSARIVKRTFTDKSEVQLPDIYMEWARLFSADPESDQTVRDGVVAEAASHILALDSGVNRVVEITCIGFASDEDDYSDTHAGTTNPGFGIPSQKNVDLGTKRGGIVTG